MTRREQNRAQLIEAIAQSAAQRLHDKGTQALTIRGIASDIGVSPAALYRYVDGLDDILTAALTRAYEDLAQAMRGKLAQVSQGEPAMPARNRLVELARAYREWSITHPNEFSLLFGTPVPGYAAPPEGPTTAAMLQLASTLMEPLSEAWSSEEITIPDSFGDPYLGRETITQALGDVAAGDLPTELGGFATAFWAQMHGMVSLELNGQFEWLAGDDAGEQFNVVISAFVESFSPSPKETS